MKNLKYLIAALLFSAIFAAWKTDDGITSADNVQGEWTGHLGEKNAAPNGSFGIRVKGDGVIERVNAAGVVSSTGLWNLNGNIFTATYTAANGIMVKIEATLDPVANKLSGNWKNNVNKLGTFSATRLPQKLSDAIASSDAGKISDPIKR